MVQQLQRGPSLADYFTRGLEGSVMPAMQQQYQRQQTLQGLRDARQNAANAQTPSDLLFALLEGTAGREGAERSVGQLYPSLLAQHFRAQATKEFPVGAKLQAGKTGRFPTKQAEGTEQQTPLSVMDIVAPKKQGLIADPTGLQNPNFQMPYDEQDFANIRQKARELNLPQDQEDRLVQDAQEINTVANTRRQTEVQNYNQQQQQRKDILENQAAFTNYVRSNAPEFVNNPDEQQLALQASDKHQNLPSFADRLAAVRKELRPYQQAKKALEKTLSRPLFGQTKEQRNLARPRAQFMVDKGQKDQLRLMIAKGGNGEVEEADLLNPLPEPFERNLNKFNKFINPLEMVTNIDSDSPKYQEQFERGQKKLESQKNQMTDFLSQNIVPGTYEKPGTNLLLTRNDLMKKGLSWDDSGKVIDDAINKGKIKLDPHQQIDYQKLAYPPLTGDDYLDTLLNNILFPITGRQ